MTKRNHCLLCKWWDEETRNPDDTKIPANQRKRAACRRYPEIAWRYSTDWCGEWVGAFGEIAPRGEK